MAKRLTKFTHFLFIPASSNNYHPKSIQSAAIIIYILFLFTTQGVVSVFSQIYPDVLGFATDISIETVYQLVNQKRQEEGLPPLNLSFELSAAAYNKAQNMFEEDYWAHVSPTGVTPWQLIENTGYKYIYAGENLAKDFDRSEDVVEAWMRSETHRANIIKPEYEDIGLAVVNGRLLGRETTLVVQEFAARSPSYPIAQGPKDAVEFEALSKKLQNRLLAKDQQRQTQLFSKEEGKSLLTLSFLNFRFTRTVSLVLAEFMLVVLFIDSVYMWKKKTIRLTGKSIFHFIFLASLLSAIGFTGFGVIL